MENAIQSIELKRLAEMNLRKARDIASLPADGIAADNIDWEVSKKNITIKISIDRGTAIEKLTWELSAKKH